MSVRMKKLARPPAAGSANPAQPKGSAFMTKTLFKGLAALVVLLGLYAGAARAADDTKSQTYAVVVGIDQYKDSQILPRKHAEDDAKLLYDVFTNPAHFSVDADHIRLLLGKEDAKRKSQPATKEN